MHRWDWEPALQAGTFCVNQRWSQWTEPKALSLCSEYPPLPLSVWNDNPVFIHTPVFRKGKWLGLSHTILFQHISVAGCLRARAPARWFLLCPWTGGEEETTLWLHWNVNNIKDANSAWKYVLCLRRHHILRIGNKCCSLCKNTIAFFWTFKVEAYLARKPLWPYKNLYMQLSRIWSRAAADSDKSLRSVDYNARRVVQAKWTMSFQQRLTDGSITTRQTEKLDSNIESSELIWVIWKPAFVSQRCQRAPSSV